MIKVPKSALIGQKDTSNVSFDVLIRVFRTIAMFPIYLKPRTNAENTGVRKVELNDVSFDVLIRVIRRVINCSSANCATIPLSITQANRLFREFIPTGINASGIP